MKRSIFSVLAVLIVTCLVATFSVAQAPEKAAVASIGSPAPTFSLTDQNGKPVSLADYQGKIVVLEWFNNECPFVVKHYSKGDMNKLASKYAEKGVAWLAINTTNGKTNEDNKKVAGEWKIDRPILNDSTGVTGKAYGAATTPHMYIINKDGTLVYKGGIDSIKSSDSSDIAKAKNYVAAALDELLDGKSVSVSETKSYGCSVKYAK